VFVQAPKYAVPAEPNRVPTAGPFTGSASAKLVGGSEGDPDLLRGVVFLPILADSEDLFFELLISSEQET